MIAFQENQTALIRANQSKAVIAKRWQSANQKINQITGGVHTLGYGFSYPKPFAVFRVEADDRSQRGYSVWRCDKGRLVALEKLILVDDF